MNANALLIERTRTAASVYFPTGTLPDICTLEDCNRACSQMNIDPKELVKPDSRMWQVILMCQQMKDGSAVFTFRGEGSEQIIQQTIANSHPRDL